MIEAICVGLPIVSTKVSGTNELVQNEINGYLVEIGDLKGMIYGLKKLIRDESRILRMGQNSKRKSQLFHIDNIAEEWLYLINKVRQ